MYQGFFKEGRLSNTRSTKKKQESRIMNRTSPDTVSSIQTYLFLSWSDFFLVFKNNTSHCQKIEAGLDIV